MTDSSTWWGNAALVLLGAVLTSIVPLGKSVSAWWRRPVLEVYQAEDSRETHVEVGIGSAGHRGHFVAVKARNQGRRAAKGCYAKLVKLERELPCGKYERVLEFRDPERLPWANRGNRRYESESIERGIPQTIDLCHTSELFPNHVCFDVRGGEIADGRQRLFVTGGYRATVRLYANSVRPATATFFVRKGRDWNDVTIGRADP
jgi:hypothetical protein